MGKLSGKVHYARIRGIVAILFASVRLFANVRIDGGGRGCMGGLLFYFC